MVMLLRVRVRVQVLALLVVATWPGLDSLVIPLTSSSSSSTASPSFRFGLSPFNLTGPLHEASAAEQKQCSFGKHHQNAVVLIRSPNRCLPDRWAQQCLQTRCKAVLLTSSTKAGETGFWAHFFQPIHSDSPLSRVPMMELIAADAELLLAQIRREHDDDVGLIVQVQSGDANPWSDMVESPEMLVYVVVVAFGSVVNLALLLFKMFGWKSPFRRRHFGRTSYVVLLCEFCSNIVRLAFLSGLLSSSSTYASLRFLLGISFPFCFVSVNAILCVLVCAHMGQRALTSQVMDRIIALIFFLSITFWIFEFSVSVRCAFQGELFSPKAVVVVSIIVLGPTTAVFLAVSRRILDALSDCHVSGSLATNSPARASERGFLRRINFVCISLSLTTVAFGSSCMLLGNSVHSSMRSVFAILCALNLLSASLINSVMHKRERKITFTQSFANTVAKLPNHLNRRTTTSEFVDVWFNAEDMF